LVNLDLLDVSCCAAIGDAAVIELARHCNMLQEVSLKHCRMVSNVSAAALSKGCKQLRKINLSETLVTIDGLRDLLKGCKKLNTITLDRCAVSKEELDEVRQVYSHVTILTDSTYAGIWTKCYCF